MDDAARRRAARAEWPVRKFDLDEDQDEVDARFWDDVSHELRAEAAWRLSQEQWSLIGPKVTNERRLPRPPWRVERR